MSRESPEQRRRRRRKKAVPVEEVDHREVAIRIAERKRRQAEREARALRADTPRRYPLTALGWLVAITTFAAVIVLHAIGERSLWSWLYVFLSGLFAAVLLIIGYQTAGASFGMPLRKGTNNGVVTNLAVVLAVLQLAAGMVGLAKELGRASTGTSTTIVTPRSCPKDPHFEFPDERS
jgi:hypothetical protein